MFIKLSGDVCMEEKYINIDILFRQMQPELLIQNIIQKYFYGKDLSANQKWCLINSHDISEECYRNLAMTLSRAKIRSVDEMRQRYFSLKDWLNENPHGGIFSLLAEYSSEVLYFQHGEPLCRQEMILDWRSRTLDLGQDLFTCAGLAANDVREHCISRNFSWPAVIHTDNLALKRILAKGMSENHFHLNGSTQIFPLAWGFLMNFPQKARQYFDDKLFKFNLNFSPSFTRTDSKESWYTLIYYAAWIRAKLFSKLHNKGYIFTKGNYNKNSFAEERFLDIKNDFSCHLRLGEKINILRNSGVKMTQYNENGYCLDYAIIEEIASNNSGANRFLAGERYFLYRCFCASFTNELSLEDQDLLYLYLIIKLRFREEIIQVNKVLGFRNFSNYQNRKNLVWGDRNSYWNESYRLSIAGCLSDSTPDISRITSLELRIMPKNSSSLLRKNIMNIDKNADFALADCNSLYRNSGKALSKATFYKRDQYLDDSVQQPNYFYVLHFEKKVMERLAKDSDKINHILHERNYEVRRQTEKQAKVLAKALGASSYLCKRIRGIDASSHEIGCRPEVFATAFRYLRSFVPRTKELCIQARYWPHIGITYHVGEDFLDISDGLRAIDEAICFLNLARGDRIGHALAMGISPEDYYFLKNSCVFLPVQDLLDNIVWLLYRSEEWNVIMPSELRASLHKKASELFRRIYGDTLIDIDGKVIDISLNDYFESWKLRGDDPDIYRYAFCNTTTVEQKIFNCRHSVSFYDRAKIDERLSDYRNQEHSNSMSQWLCSQHETKSLFSDVRTNRKIQYLLYKYHYGFEERQRGQQVERFQIEPNYIMLIRKMQDEMIKKIMIAGIAIECNPSSNVLIGTFGMYEKHPIFRFNHFGLNLPEYDNQNFQLDVSVNTDDQGVFDTILENEYSILFGCLQSRKNSHGEPLIDKDSIYQYLDHLREMGNRMVFPSPQKFYRTRVIHQGDV